MKIGLKSTAVLFEDRPKQWLTGFGVTTSSLLLLAGLSSSITWPYYLGLGVTSCHLAWQVSMRFLCCLKSLPSFLGLFCGYKRS